MFWRRDSQVGLRKIKKRPGKFTKSSKFQKKLEDKKVGSCWKCGGPHFKRDYPKVKKNTQPNGHPNAGQDNQGHNLFVVTNDVDNNMIFIAMLSEICVVQDDESWWIDTGATRHVCKDRHTFKTLKELQEGLILYMGNDSTVQIQGIGQVELQIQGIGQGIGINFQKEINS
ncbi:unnamed protein product [Cuscuta epithymum]|uniref:Retrovirus-related Pol polyprotein from transposon TNT 1-94-like beta-barrel domain-containing protein n=1 Tax=Cuscuta epithymum TaxID=186058 RepID=A0AAV0F1C6_9ASTE|nr:unnamed protein product [Cuscuta epithymum]